VEACLPQESTVCSGWGKVISVKKGQDGFLHKGKHESKRPRVAHLIDRGDAPQYIYSRKRRGGEISGEKKGG